MLPFALHILAKFWSFTSAFLTIYIILGALLTFISWITKAYSSLTDCPGYLSLSDCMILVYDGPEIAPLITSVLVGIAASLFLMAQRSGSSLLLYVYCYIIHQF